MTPPEPSSYVEAYEDAEGGAVVDVCLSPEDIGTARRSQATLAVDDEKAGLGVGEVHVRQTASGDDARTAQDPRGHHPG